MYYQQQIHYFANSHTVKTQKIVKPFWETQRTNNPSKNLKKKMRFFFKWFKFIVYAFIFIITLWGCFQQYGQPYTVSVSTVGQGLEFGYEPGTTGDYRFDLSWEHTGTYWTFSQFSLTFGPFISFFVYPLAKISLDLIYYMHPKLAYGGFATLFVILIVLIIMRSLIFWPQLKGSLLSEKTLEHQGAIAEINAKYAKVAKDDKAAKYRKQQELQEYNRRHGLNPLGSLESTFIAIPVFVTILKLFGILRPIKATILFGIWDLSQVPFTAIFRHFNDGGWVYIFLLLFVIPTQIVSNKLPQYLSKKRNYKALSYSKQGDEQMQKNARIQNTLTGMFSVFPLFISSGIGIYYFFSSLFTIAQNIVIHKIIQRRRKQGKNIDDYLVRFGIIETSETSNNLKLFSK